MTDEIVIVGFPKAGTSALIRGLMKDTSFNVLTSPNGSLEIIWPLIKELRKNDTERILAHKYTAYVYHNKTLEYLRDINHKSKIVLCVRHPRMALISWHKMHQSLACSGRIPEHFAFKKKEFYAHCSIPEYYREFAESRLKYDELFKNLISIFPKDRVLVISQERMAICMDTVIELIKSFVKDKDLTLVTPQKNSQYVGYADKTNIKLDVKINNELEQIQSRLYKAISESGVAQYLI